ncbi:MAG: polyprenyl synthetase family protein [Chlamydiia bacterium]
MLETSSSKKKDFEKALFAEIYSWKNSELREAALYALEGEAKRIRPLIALEIALELNPNYENYHPMIALELAHTCSLILDDLPMMDDAEERRHKKSLHKAFDEPRALLTAVGLISEGYNQLLKGADRLKGTNLESHAAEILRCSLEYTSKAGGMEGAPLGQFMDLTIDQDSSTSLITLMHKKTGVFFETAFVLGWIFGGGETALLPLVEDAAFTFGQIFQIVDDYLDQEEDQKERPFANFVIQTGEGETMEFLEKEKERLATLLTSLKLFKLQQVLLAPLEQLLLLHRSVPCC